MEYRIRIDDIRVNYKINEKEKTSDLVKLQHHPGSKILMLPYITNLKKTDKDYIVNFNVVLGELFRLITGKKIKDGLGKEQLISELEKRVSTEKIEDKSTFIDIINNVFFEKNGLLQIFHPKIFIYINTEKNFVHKKIAQFLYDVLCNEEAKEALLKKYNDEPNNILYKLVLDTLPGIINEPQIDKCQYKNFLPFITKLFISDLKIMVDDTKFFVDDFEKLIKYYYFFYVSQLSIKLNKMFVADLSKADEIYFNLDKESTSKSRTSYYKGWEALKSTLKPLFSHANCLEFLNHRNDESKGPFSYMEIRNKICKMDESNQIKLLEDLNSLIELYKNCIGDFDWDKHHFDSDLYEDELLNKIYELYKVIDLQFNNTSRNNRYKHYEEWFEEFCKSNFLKTRGQLGYTLNLTEEYLIFITKLCIPKGDKMRLNYLFKAYEKRGLFFDRDSKYKIIEIFEKLNLLEKKSDSGDAQYVKSIL